MRYALTRHGQTLGSHTREEIQTLLQAGQVSPDDLAQGEGQAQPVCVAQLLAPTPAAAAPPLTPATGTYLVRRGAEQFGPYSFVELQRYAVEGRILPADVAWSAGMTTWESVGQLLAQRGSPLPPGLPLPAETNEALTWVLPVGRSSLAIAAGYLGLFSILLLPAPIALVVGLLALRDLKKNPKKMGVGRAWFGTIAGGLGTLALTLIFISAAVARR
jgi:hypothetical protein